MLLVYFLLLGSTFADLLDYICLSDSDCWSISNARCSELVCKSCNSNSQCIHLGLNQCKSGVCLKSCSSSTDSTCRDYYAVCSSNQCIGCSRDSDCFALYGPKAQCDYSRKRGTICKECSDWSDCTTVGKVCTDRLCSFCASNPDCYFLRPVCSTSSNLCTICTSQSHCTSYKSYPYCFTNGSCVNCLADSNCTDSNKPICSTGKYCRKCKSGECYPQQCDSSGACVECLSDTDCTSPNVCLSNKKCGPCSSNSDCPQFTPFCLNGVCRQCLSSNNCINNYFCNSTYSCALKSCLNGASCTSLVPFCNTTDYKCWKCLSDSHCSENIYKRCYTNGSCVECLNSTGCLSSINKPLCGSNLLCRKCLTDSECFPLFCNASGSCVACTNNSQCGPNLICSARTYTCSKCTVNADCMNNQYCLALSGLCYNCTISSHCLSNYYCSDFNCIIKECSSNSQCNSFKPRCNLTDYKCTNCNLDTECSSLYLEFPFCSKNGSCLANEDPYPCTTIGDCPFKLPVCNNTSSFCISCTDSSECPNSRPYCKDSFCYNCLSNDNCTLPLVCVNSTKTCSLCENDQDCPSNLPHCFIGNCLECLTTNDCNPGYYCNSDSSKCIVKECDTNSNCSNILPVCDSVYFNCTPCVDSKSCSFLYPICSNNGSCIQCTQNSECSGNTPICGLDKRCHPCLSDFECGSLFCNSTGSCVECSNYSQCVNSTLCLSPDNTCGPCRYDSDCPYPTKFCQDSICLNCRNTLDCGNILEYCDPFNYTCANKACLNSLECDLMYPLCDPVFFNCTFCRNDLDCPSNFSKCHSNGSCVECIQNSDCADPVNAFCFNNTCQACRDNNDCGSSICDLGYSNQCLPPECTHNTQCLSIRASKCENNLCKPCENYTHCAHFPINVQCSTGYCIIPVCNTLEAPLWNGTSCSYCNNNGDCLQFETETICHDQLCVECATGLNCSYYEPICRNQDNRCAKCNSSAECEARDIFNPYCHQTGACVECLGNSNCINPDFGYCDLNSSTCQHCQKNEDCYHFTTQFSISNCLNSTCTGCPRNCQNCTNSTNCTLCSAPYSLFNGECGLFCPPGYKLFDNLTCGEFCGDGVKRTPLPFCDDGNNKNGDGCSSICQVENGWLCEYGDKYNPDICRLYPAFTITQSSPDTQVLLIKFNQIMKFPTNLSKYFNLSIDNTNSSQYTYDIEVLDGKTLSIRIVPAYKLFSPFIHINIEKFQDFLGVSNLSLLNFTFDEQLKSIEYISNSQLKTAKTITATAAGAATAGLVLAAPSFFTNPAITFALINLLQMFYYLLYLNVDYPVNVQIFLAIFSIGTFEFIPNPLEIISPGITDDSLPAPQRFLDLGISGYFLSDQGSLIFVWGIIGIGYLIMAFLAKFVRALPSILKSIFFSLIGGFEWAWMINAMLTSYLNLNIASFLQINALTFDTNAHAISSVFGILVCITNVSFIFWAMRVISKYRNYPKYMKFKYGPLVEDFKDDGEYSIYFSIVILTRRFFAALVYVFFQKIPYFQVLLLLLHDIIGIMALITLNPYKQPKNKMLNLHSEFAFIVIHGAVLLIHYDNSHMIFDKNERILVGWIIISFVCLILGLNFVVLMLEQIEIFKKLNKLLAWLRSKEVTRLSTKRDFGRRKLKIKQAKSKAVKSEWIKDETAIEQINRISKSLRAKPKKKLISDDDQ